MMPADTDYGPRQSDRELLLEMKQERAEQESWDNAQVVSDRYCNDCWAEWPHHLDGCPRKSAV